MKIRNKTGSIKPWAAAKGHRATKRGATFADRRTKRLRSRGAAKRAALTRE